MQTVTITLPKPHAAQQTVLDEARRFNVFCAGRRTGKTTLCLDRLIQPALVGYPVAWFSPTYKMLTEVWRTARELLTPITGRVSDGEHRIELITGGVVDMWSLENADSVRGRKYKRVVIDEAAQDPKLEGHWQRAIRPTLTDYEGDAWFPSTPRGLNYFHAIWQRGQDPAETEWAAWQMPTTANPYIAPKEVEAARRELPALVFAQEYLAEFIPDGAGIFRRVRDAAVAEPQTAPVEGHSYLISVDWGKIADWTVLAVWDTTLGDLVAIDRFQQIDYTVQIGRLQGLCERFRPFALAPERNSIGDPIIEQIARAPWCPPVILPFTTTNASKALAVEAFALALETGTVRFVDDPVLVGELHAFKGTRLPSGLVRYGAPEGMHDDCVMAVIIGFHALTGGMDEPETVVYDEPVTISPY